MVATQATVTLSDGARLVVRLLGDSGDRSKPLLIALHGAPGLSSHLEAQSTFSFLTPRFRVLVYDARGSGESDLQPPFTDERWIADIDELRQWAGEERFILAGYSYGSFVALGYAIAHPGRIRAVIVQSAWACGFHGALRSVAKISRSTDVKTDPAQLIRFWSGSVVDNNDLETAFAALAPLYTVTKSPAAKLSGGREKFKMFKTFPHYETHNVAFGFNTPRFDVRARLHEIKAPVLIAVGRQDLVTTVEDSEELHDGICNSELAVFENSGHNAQSEEPDAFRAKVWDFLTQTVSRADSRL